MKRAALICFHLAAGVSLLLCVAAVGLWGWEWSTELRVMRVRPRSIDTLDVSRGALRVWTVYALNPRTTYPDRMLGWTFRTYPGTDLVTGAQRGYPNARPPVAGFFVGHAYVSGYDTRMILLPMALIVLLLAILPLAAGARLMRRRRRSRRLAAGCCVACGYDLRASPEKCPECGRASPLAGR